MRDGWRQITLGDVAIRRKDFTPVRGDGLYRIVGVQRSGWGLVDRDPVRGDSMKFGKLLELRTDDLVYRTITAFEAPSAVVSPEFDGAFVTPTTFPTYAFDHAQLLPGYMALLTTSPAFHEEMASRCVGSVLRRKTLSQKAFESIPVALPPPDDQRRIVDLVAAVDAAVTAAQTEASASSAAAESLRDIWFGTASVEVIAGEVYEISAGKQLQKSLLSGELVPYVRAGNLSENRVDVADIKLMRATDKDIEKLKLTAGDVLVVEGGFGYGKNAVWKDGLPSPVIFQNHVLRVRPIDSRYSSEYASMWAKWCYEAGKWRPTGTDLLNVGVGNARQMRLRALDVDGLPEALTAAQKQDDLAGAARATADALRTLRTNLLTVLLSGEHEIPASYDELLEVA